MHVPATEASEPMGPTTTDHERPTGGRLDRGSAGRLDFVPPILFAVVALVGYLLWEGEGGLLFLAAVSMAFGVERALVLGGPRITPSGVFFVASSIFVGLAAYYLAGVETDIPVDTLRTATVIALGTTTAIALMVTALSVSKGIRLPGPAKAARVEPPPHFVTRGLALVMVGLVPVFGSILGPVARAVGLAGLLMLVLWAASRRVNLRWYGDILVVVLSIVLPLLWSRLTFTGGGRLMVAGVGIAAFLGWNLLNPKRTQKVLVILAIPLFLWAAGLDRASEEGERSASSVVGSGEGLASVYSPLETFGRVIGPLEPQERERLMPRWGATFVNTAYLPIPRQVWDTKPKGFGAELTEALEPQLVRSNHSMAALWHGEWYANFGYAGLFLMVPATAVFLGWLDRLHAEVAWSELMTTRSWWRTAMLLCLVSSLADLYWVGAFSYMARGGLAALALAAIARMSLSRSAPLRPWAPRPRGAASTGA